MKLLIVIPALNEEQSIESTIERCLAARDVITAASPVTAVEITVVSDGSTDRTVDLARRYTDRVNLIVFETNRGYGAAIKEGWSRSDADLLAFIDADGTCDPAFFAELCRRLLATDADVILGSRLNKASRMPMIRRIGNRLFAAMLGALGTSAIRDTASGMRVVRRDRLQRLMPLPDGLNFTPAMTARAILGSAVRIVEIDMPYAERAGRSKLRLVQDGVRFARVIFEAALLYQPARPLVILALMCFAAAVTLMATPVTYYLGHRAVQEWMIYRFVVSHLAGTAACLFLCASYLTTKIVGLTLGPPTSIDRTWSRVGWFIAGRGFWVASTLLILAGGALILPSFLQLVRMGATYEHWSRFIAMSFFWSVALILIVTHSIDYVLDLLAAQLRYTSEHGSGPGARSPLGGPSS